MAKRDWTDKQRQAITAVGGAVLVSAAAGSGKTAVLVERVIRRITDDTHPISIDRLLIVTFTRAAATEMRQRLSVALAEKVAQQPENRIYQEQQLLLPQAHISTIHGFCTKLLQEYAGPVGLPIGFKVAEDTQAQLLAAEALDLVLEENYRQGDSSFLALANQLNSQKSDTGLREAIQQAYTFMQAQPFPHRWLKQQMDAYTQVIPLENTPWMQPILQELTMRLEAIRLLADKALAVAQQAGLEPYLDALLLDCNRLQDLQKQLSSLPYDALFRAVTDFAPERLSAIRAKDATIEEGKAQVKKLRDRMKRKLLQAAALFCGTEEECRQDLAEMAPLVETLGDLVEQYARQFTALKRQQKLLDYNDLEQETLKLLLDETTGGPTPLAVEISGRFSEILVDEYQDTNAAQDALFRVISRGGENRFMVGDVKQSIYGFRQAMPKIFTAKRDRYTPYDPVAPTFPTAITLENNFRSREDVTETVNFLFRQLMQEELGGVAYTSNEELVCSAKYPEEGDHRTHWMLLDMAAGAEEGLSPEQAEIGLLARQIRKLRETACVQTPEGPRPLAWQDVCVLLRTRKAVAHYAKELNRLGIPTAAEAGASLLAAPEVQLALSLLRIIDNPLREVELAAVMLSPLYGFTPDELALLRLASGRRTPLYTILETYREEPALAARCQRLLADLRRYRTLAVTMPADRLLEQIYRETGLEAVYAVRSGGRQRVANLRQLDQVARHFEQGGFRGLSAFIRYVDRLEEQDKDLPCGSTQQQDGVRLMTVHGSKGLEFPVVFLARLYGQRSNEDARKKLLFHADAGIGMRLWNTDEQEKHTTLPFLGVQSARRLEAAAEELRVWYVALTRAREQLFLIYTAKDLNQHLATLAAELPNQLTLLPETAVRATTYADLLLAAALRHPDMAPVRTEALNSLPAACRWQVTLHTPETVAEDATAMGTMPPEDTTLTQKLRPRLTYTYPYEPLLGVPAKLAASQLSHEALQREHVATTRPNFLQQEALSAADRGTALHTFMQFADLQQAARDLSGEVRRLTEARFLTPTQAEVLPLEKLQQFFSGPLFARLSAAPQVWREYPFTIAVEAGSLTPLPTPMAEEPVVVQGIADCVFREGDGLVLVDYKTDRVKDDAALANHYRSQMLFYKQALETLLGLPVKEMLLYSFALDRTVEILPL